MKYKRILLKLSGEALKNNKNGIVDFDYVLNLCRSIASLKNNGVSIGIVVGGGNIWRGRDNTYIDSSSSDKIGILATSMNALILKSAFDKLNVESVLYNSFEAKNILEVTPVGDELTKFNNNIIIFGGGTGNVGCSTDKAAANKAKDMQADIIIKLTNVDGIYNKDPNLYKDAVKYDEITYKEVIDNNLHVMDLDAIKLCMENDINILVTNINYLFDIESLEKNKSYSIIKG